jgi:hypothetical protein
MFRRLLIRTVAIGAVIAAVMLPATHASAATTFYFTDQKDGSLDGYTIYGRSGSASGPVVGEVELWSAYGGPVVRELELCDDKSDGQPVYAAIRVPDGRVLKYKAPAHDAPGDGGGTDGCLYRALSYPITSYALIVGNSTSGWLNPPPLQ